MPAKQDKRWSGRVLLLAVLLSICAMAQAAAQAAAFARLSNLDTSEFPLMQGYLDVHREDGGFWDGLQAEEVTVRENGLSLAVDELQPVYTDVQMVTAITLGPSFSVRDGLGVTRYEYLVQGLKGWKWDADAGDDLSLLIADGPEVVHSSSYTEWMQALTSFKMAPEDPSPNLQVLNRALDIAGDPSPRPGMERMVLFITPPLGVQAAAGLQSIAGLAQQENIRIFVWLVGAPEYEDSVEAQMLRTLAGDTSGEYFFFSGTEAVPDLETYLAPLRQVYRFTFTSAVRSTGAFPLSVAITTTETTLITPDLLVQYKVQAPNLVFMGAPSEIMRSAASSNPASQPLQATPLPLRSRLTPAAQDVEIMVEFPDGNPRPLERSALYANEVLVDENLAEPFDQFTWDLRTITETQSYLLRAEVTDSLGLTSSTVGLPVQVVVELPGQGLGKLISNQGLVLAGLMVLLAGSVLGLVLLMGGRIRPRVSGGGSLSRAGGWNMGSRMKDSAATSNRASQNLSPTRPAAGMMITRPVRKVDPVTQPVNIPQAAARPAAKNAGRRLSLPVQLRMPAIPRLGLRGVRAEMKRIETALEPLPVHEEADAQAPLPLTVDEIQLGRSPTEATWVIDEPSLEAVHATLRREGSSYRVWDAGTTAGTWVNYQRVPEEGVLLLHGDLVHLGRVGFRFVQRMPGITRKPVIMVYNSDKHDSI